MENNVISTFDHEKCKDTNVNCENKFKKLK